MSDRFDEIDNDIYNLLKQIQSISEKIKYDNLNLHNGLNMVYLNIENLRRMFYEDMGRNSEWENRKVIEKLKDEGVIKDENEMMKGGPQFENEDPRQGE